MFTILRIGILYFGIELLYSLETALTVPILLQLKVPDKCVLYPFLDIIVILFIISSIYSFVWLLSPILGIFIQPILGVMSDRCQSKFGRRRPFIAILALGAYLGIALILNSIKIGVWMGDTPSSKVFLIQYELNLAHLNLFKIPYFAVIVTGVGVTFLDFCADSSDSPLRAFLLDVCHVDDQDTGLNMHAMLGGLGSSLGFVLVAINWKNTFFKYIGKKFKCFFKILILIYLLFKKEMNFLFYLSLRHLSFSSLLF